jgi:hypothetical protein
MHTSTSGAPFHKNKEIRWYKGRYKVEVVLKSKGNWRVKALESVRITPFSFQPPSFKEVGEEFTTVPRLLWKHPK